jgi:phosphatidylglycerophosphatase A
LNEAQGSESPPFREAFKGSGFKGRAALILSTWFGTGLFPLAPGTIGTLASVPFAAVMMRLGPVPHGIFILCLVPIAVWSAHVSQGLLLREDPSEVVIDETAGFCLSVFLLPFSLLTICLGFIFFRIFDILKPFPIGFADRNIKGGLGICLDDLIAGLFANICIRIILAFIR